MRKRLTALAAVAGLLPGLATAQDTFHYEQTKAQYRTRDYVC
jgi:hypothetical protein